MDRQGAQGLAGAGGGNLHFSDVTLLNLRLFANLGQQKALVAKHPWLRGSRVTLAVIFRLMRFETSSLKISAAGGFRM